MEAVLRKTGMHRNAADNGIIDRCKRDVTAAFSTIEKESAKVGLVVNERNMKYMLSTASNNSDPAYIRRVPKFVYICVYVNISHYITLDVKRRITLVKGATFGLVSN